MYFLIYTKAFPKLMKTTDVSGDFGAEKFDSFVCFFRNFILSYRRYTLPETNSKNPWKWWKSQ